MSTDFSNPSKSHDNQLLSWFDQSDPADTGALLPDKESLITRLAQENSLLQKRQSLRSAFLAWDDKPPTLNNLTISEDRDDKVQAKPAIDVEQPPVLNEAAVAAPAEATSRPAESKLTVDSVEKSPLTPALEITDNGKATPFENIEKQVHSDSASSKLLSSLGLDFGPNSFQTWTWRHDGTRSTAIMNNDGLTRIVSCRPDGTLTDCVKRDGLDLVRFNPNGEVVINSQLNRSA